VSGPHTILLRLAGPMQSWGSRSRFGERDTEREPTKSGVIGLVCAALGRPREAPLEDLARLRVGVRVDREGVLERDFQTALQVRKSDPSAKPDTTTSNRYYLADAVFLVGLEGDDLALLESVDRALSRPRWSIALGRKAFVPGEQVRLQDGLRRDTPLERALTEYPRLAKAREGARAEGGEVEKLRLQVECRPGEPGEVRQDVPLSFVSDARKFGIRNVRYQELPVAGGQEGEPCT
jgi:CRISPR system Cascade subunit CasD